MEPTKPGQFMELIGRMNNEGRSIVAACALGMVNPTHDNLDIFFEQLKTEDEDVYNQLILRAVYRSKKQ